MYANLVVGISKKPLEYDANGGWLCDEEVYASAVDVDGTRATIKLDEQDAMLSYAEPAGERVVDLTTHAISIGADF